MPVEDEREVTIVFPRELEKELWNHPGKWVAIVDDAIFADGDTAREVVTQARAAGHSEPMLYKVPAPGTLHFFRADRCDYESLFAIALRTTTVLRPEQGVWKVVHRHADPITSVRPPESIIQG